MGAVTSLFKGHKVAEFEEPPPADPGFAAGGAANERRDMRKRNSLVFGIHDSLEAEGFEKLVEESRGKARALADKQSKADYTDPRVARQNLIAENIALGNMRSLREQVIGHYNQINKQYEAEWELMTLLHIVCQEGFLEMLKFIINPRNRSMFDNAVMQVDPEDTKGRTPLLKVFSPPHMTFSAKRFGVDDEKKVALNERPQGIEVETDWIKPGGQQERQAMVKILIEQGCDVHKEDFHGYTPLLMAAIWGWRDTVVELIKAGAEIEKICVTGANVLHLACQYGWPKIVEYLLEETEIIMHTRDTEGSTPIHVASQHNQFECVKLLVEFEADVNVLNYAKRSPLYYACQNSNLAMINTLLDYKANHEPEAFELMEGNVKFNIEKRLELEEKERREAAEAAAKLATAGGKLSRTLNKQNPYGQWVPYIDKISKKVFYYNKVSRQSQWEKPADYMMDKTYICKEATYGLHFYH
mmetsp:Transcript_11048/g.33593  ORF Transcript_11048/g.33593 Transcript_11048/m.33593 type:complete len:471 (-) Transcript_11048:1439-2851(-)